MIVEGTTHPEIEDPALPFHAYSRKWIDGCELHERVGSEFTVKSLPFSGTV
jgi:hypothetical protein